MSDNKITLLKKYAAMESLCYVFLTVFLKDHPGIKSETYLEFVKMFDDIRLIDVTYCKCQIGDAVTQSEKEKTRHQNSK